MILTKWVVEEAAKRMVDAWCYAPRGTPDWEMEWKRNRERYLKQARAALSVVNNPLPWKEN